MEYMHGIYCTYNSVYAGTELWCAVLIFLKVFSDIKKNISEIRFLDIRKNGPFSDIRKLMTRSN